MPNLKKVHKEGVGTIYQLFNQVELYRLMHSLPIYGVLVDVYYPKDVRGSIAGLKTTDLKYSKKPDLENVKVLITNLEHYSQNETIYESFEEDGFQLKALVEEGQTLPNSSKVVVKDYRGDIDGDEEHITFVVTKSYTSSTPVNKKIGWKCELTPMYLMTDSSELLLNVKEVIERDAEHIIPNYVEELNKYEKDIIREAEEEGYEDVDTDIIRIDREGGLYNG